MNLNHNSILLYSFILLMSISACATNKMSKWMEAHQNSLQQAMGSNVSPEQKLDIVAQSFVNVLNESMSYTKAKHSVKHVNQYSKLNEDALNALTKDVEQWFSSMSTTDKVLAVGKIAQKPYTKELITLIPKFEKKVNRKIQTFRVASKIIKAVTPKLF